MKYSSRPKPVRIRLESGGREHFSLDSLLENFNPADLISKKKELIRWLSTQQGGVVEQLCQKLEQIDFNSKNVFQLYKIFFGDYIVEKSITNLKDLLLSWIDIDEYNANVEFLKPFCYQDAETLVNLYNDEKYKWLENDRKSIIERFVMTHYIEKDNDNILDFPQLKSQIDQPLLLYYLGCEYISKDLSQARFFLQFAQKYGVKEAEAKLKEISSVKETISPLSKDFNEELVQNIITYSILHYSNTSSSAKEMMSAFWRNAAYKKRELSPDEERFVEFSFSCCYLMNESNIAYKYDQAKELLTTNNEDKLKKEKEFLVCLIGSRSKNKRIKDYCEAFLKQMDYLPALYLYGKRKDQILDSSGFFKKDLDGQIRTILEHIFYFRGNDNTDVIESEIIDEEAVRKIIQYAVSNFDSLHWGTSRDMVKDYFAPGRISQFNNNEWLFFDFAFDCMILKRYPGYNEKVVKAKEKMTKYENSLLKKEAVFIVDLISYMIGTPYRKSTAKKELSELDYFPAKYLLDNSLKDETLDKVNYRLINVDHEIRYLLRYIFSFR